MTRSPPFAALPIILLAFGGCDGGASGVPDASHPATADAASLPDARVDASGPSATDASATDASATDASATDATHAADATLQADADPADDGVPPGAIVLVAPSVCRTTNGHLLGCHFGPVTVPAPTTTLPPGQYKTRVTGHHQGNCSSTFLFETRLSADGVAPFTYVLFFNEEAILRRDDSAALASVRVENGSSFPGSGSYGLDCRVWIEVEFNVAIATAR